MRELTVLEQENLNGGWNWWGLIGTGFSAAGAALEYLGDLGMEVPPIGGALELGGIAFQLAGELMN